VTEGLIQLFTGVVGSVAGANLLVLVLDIARDLRVRDPFPKANDASAFRATRRTPVPLDP
jgi:hypothetical protein